MCDVVAGGGVVVVAVGAAEIDGEGQDSQCSVGLVEDVFVGVFGMKGRRLVSVCNAVAGKGVVATIAVNAAGVVGDGQDSQCSAAGA